MPILQYTHPSQIHTYSFTAFTTSHYTAFSNAHNIPNCDRIDTNIETSNSRNSIRNTRT